MDGAEREQMGNAGLGEVAFHAWTSMRARRMEREDAERRKRTRERLVLLNHVIESSVACTEVAQHLARRLVFAQGGYGRGRACWKQRRAQNNFYELFSERTTDVVFKRLLRMNKESFRVLLRLVRRDLEPAANARGDFMSPKRTLTLTLMRLAHGTSYLKLSESFAIGISTAHKCYTRGIAAICRIQDRFIRMPTTCAEIEACIQSFSRRGFPNACLAVDGCHVKVELADQNLGLQDFVCYKGFYSLNNMAYVDGSGMFKAVLCGWAGSSADGGVIKEMEFTKLLQNGLLVQYPTLYKDLEYLDRRGHSATLHVPPLVLADSAFGMETWQMTPYKGDNLAATSAERRFNWIHSSTRVVVEHAFGRLKGRFRLLLGTHRTAWSTGAQSILAAMVLHNFLGQEGDAFMQEWAEGVVELGDRDGVQPEEAMAQDMLDSAVQIKQGLTDFFFQQERPVRRPRNR